MKKNAAVCTAVLLGAAAAASAQAQPAAPAPAPAAIPTKIAVINLNEAIARTKEGQKAAAEINTKYGPKMAEADKRQAEIDSLTDQLNKGRATMSDDAQRKLAADIQGKTTSLKRFREDSQSEIDIDDQKIGGDLSGKMGQIITQYAVQNGYAVVLNVGTETSPVLWASQATNITDEMIKLYDQIHPVKEEPASAGKPPSAPPAAPPVKKK